MDFEEWLLDPPDLRVEFVDTIISSVLLRVRAGPGEQPRSVVTGWLRRACLELSREAFHEARHLDPHTLLRGLVMAHEALRISQAGLLLAARDETRRNEDAAAIDRELPYAAARAISMRFAVETHSAIPPTGHDLPSSSQLADLWAYAFAITQLGTTSDEIHLGLLPSQLRLATSGRLELPHSPHQDARRHRHAQAVAKERQDPLRQALGMTQDDFPLTASETRTEEALRAEIDRALADHAGLSLSRMCELIGWLGGMAGFQPYDDRPNVSPGGFNSARMSDLVPVIEALFSTTAQRAQTALRFLSIGPDPSFPGSDHRPWIFGRKRSFQARPLVMHPDGATVSWSGLHTYCSADLIGSQLVYGALPGVARDSSLQAAMQNYSTWRGAVFESQVESVLRADFRLRASRVSKLDGRPLTGGDGAPLGDIDVLVAEPISNTLVLIEAKASAPGATPRDLHYEFERFASTTRGTDLNRHLRRMTYIETHKDEALRALGLRSEDADQWSVAGAIVTQMATLVGWAAEAPVPVLSIQQLRDLDLVAWIGSLGRV